MTIINSLLIILFAHMVGDFVLQPGYVNDRKGESYLYLFVHSVLYALPMYYLWGLDWKWVIIFFTHMIIDLMKARYELITIWQDQLAHIVILIIVYMVL